MASYVVLTPPGGPLPDHRTTLFIRDGLSVPALLFPLIYLLVHRLWIPALAFLAAQILASMALQLAGAPDGAFALLAILNLWPGLEAGDMRVQALLKRGHVVAAIVPAPDLETAEASFFAGEDGVAPAPRTVRHPMIATSAARHQPGPALGLIDY